MSPVELLSSVLSGGVTGLLGVVVQKIADYKSKELDLQLAATNAAHEVEMRKADAEIMKQEWASRTQIAQVEAQGLADQSANQAFAQALISEPKFYSDPTKLNEKQEWIFVSVDVIRAMVRPALTLYLAVLTTLIYWQAKELMNGAVDPTRASELLNLIVSTILYLFTTATLYYFGTRNTQRAPKV